MLIIMVSVILVVVLIGSEVLAIGGHKDVEFLAVTSDLGLVSNGALHDLFLDFVDATAGGMFPYGHADGPR